MCTVTFLPLGNADFMLTSNRDEQKLRITLPPKHYLEDEIKLAYPKDKLAGGTWIGVSNNKRLICVLNGAFKKHSRADNYKKSRGVIVKELLKSQNLKYAISELNLEGVEPFTMIFVEWNTTSLNLYELVWDGNEKYFSKLDLAPTIWASSTLYADKAKELRKNWFNEFLQQNDFSQKAILKFHHLEKGDKEQAILMKRSYVETVSITSVKKENTNVTMFYEDVVFNKKSTLKF